jgi:hypothetical protein
MDEILFGLYSEIGEMPCRSTETHNQIDSLREQLRDDVRFAELESQKVIFKQYLCNRFRKTISTISMTI